MKHRNGRWELQSLRQHSRKGPGDIPLQCLGSLPALYLEAVFILAAFYQPPFRLFPTIRLVMMLDLAGLTPQPTFVKESCAPEVGTIEIANSDSSMKASFHPI
jgi:hypothetical protein